MSLLTSVVANVRFMLLVEGAVDTPSDQEVSPPTTRQNLFVHDPTVPITFSHTPLRLVSDLVA
jgi:hypothetical protein